MEEKRHGEVNDTESALTGTSEAFSDELIDLLFLILLFGYSESLNLDNNGSAPVVIDEEKTKNKFKKRKR